MIKAIKKIGLVAAIIGSLTLGGLTINNPKGLESKIPSIGMSVAEAKEINPDGYEVPTLINGPINSKEYVEDKIKYMAELFNTSDGGQTVRLRVGDKIFAYVIDHDKIKPFDYTIYDNDGDKIFETKYIQGESINLPDWVKQ